MPEFAYQDPFPLAPIRPVTASSMRISFPQRPSRERRSSRSSRRRFGFWQGKPCGMSRSCTARRTSPRSRQSSTIPRPRPTTGALPWPCCETPRWPPGSSCRCARTPARRRSSARRASASGPAAQGRGVAVAGRLRDLSEREPALLADHSRSRCTTRSTPARTCRPRSTSSRPRARSTSSCSSPREADRPTSRCSSRRPRRCSIRRAWRSFSRRSCVRWARPPARPITSRS